MADSLTKKAISFPFLHLQFPFNYQYIFYWISNTYDIDIAIDIRILPNWESEAVKKVVTTTLASPTQQ